MSRYIDANVARARLMSLAEEASIEGTDFLYYRDVIEAFDDVETANPDLVEIVRCKNCKYFRRGDTNMFRGDGKCTLLFVAMKNNDYCSYGKEK